MWCISIDIPKGKRKISPFDNMLIGKHLKKYYAKYWWLLAIGILSLIVVDVAQTFIPRFLGQIIDENNELVADLAALGVIVGWIMLCAVIMFVGRAIWRLSIFRASTGIAAGLRREMFIKAETLDAGYYHRNKTGDIMNWFTSDIEEISEYFGWGTVMIIDAFFLSLSVLISMFRLNVWLSLIAIAPILLIVIWGALVEKIMSSRWERRQKEFDRLYDFAQENFTGIRVIKSFVKAKSEIRAFSKIAEKNKAANLSFAHMSVFFDDIIETILIFEMVLVMGVGGYFAYATSQGTPVVIFDQEISLTVGGLLEFIGYIDLIIWPMIALGQVVSMHSRAKASLKRISVFLDANVDVLSPEHPIPFENQSGSIIFNNLTFTYPDTKDPSLRNVTCEIRPGEHIGIVGKVGSGKSTFVSVLFRLYNLPHEALVVDGVDVMDADIKELRNHIAYAPQDNFLFSDTIENNVGFAEENGISIEKAAEFAALDSDISTFPAGIKTTTGERGVTLSGGQKQRVSIARAYYRDAPILVLDDCVSAVDLKTEERILEHIKNDRAGKTTLLIASRVSSVMQMDRIFVMDQGELIATGTHHELVKTCPLYARMVALQELEALKGGED